MYFVGVNPGKTGGIARINSELGIIEAWPMPEHFGGLALLLHRLRTHEPHETFFFIERAEIIPKQNPQSAFTFGKNFGAILGYLGGINAQIRMITAEQWKGMMLAGSSAPTDKKRALEVAQRIWPGRDFSMQQNGRTPHDGMVSSLLIARFAEISYNAVQGGPAGPKTSATRADREPITDADTGASADA